MKTNSIYNNIAQQLIDNCDNPADLLSSKGGLHQLKKSIVESLLRAELNEHLGHEKYTKSTSGNYRNGTTPKQVKTDDGVIPLDIPRDRASTFEPKIIEKNQTVVGDLNEKIISMYGRGMSNQDISDHIKDMYGMDVSKQFISDATKSVLDEFKIWQAKPLDSHYPIVFLDCIHVKSNVDSHIKNLAVYVVLGVNMDGHKEALGLWIARTEGAKFWLSVLNDLKQRGLEEIFIVCVDGLKGFSEAITAVYPNAQVQRCIVHMIRNSLKFVPYKEKKEVAADLKTIYNADNKELARNALTDFQTKWCEKYPTIYEQWDRAWPEVVPFLAYPNYIRKAIYTTNAIESCNRGIRKVIKNRSILPTQDSVFKLIYLSLKNAAKKWTMPIREHSTRHFLSRPLER